MWPSFLQHHRQAQSAPVPPAVPVATTAAIHILASEGLVRLDDGFILACGADGATARLRLDDIAQVSLHGAAGITTPCLIALMARSIPVIWRTRGGHYAGQSIDLSGTHTAVRRAQYRAAADPASRLAIARAIVVAKLHSAAAVADAKGAVPLVRLRLLALARQAATAEDHSSLLGIEGSAAALYFGAFPIMIMPRQRASFPFPGRRRRPPTDPVNAVLSYLYAVLAGECAVAVLAAQLDPAVGFLHAERPGRPALALDLLELLRAPVADRLALRLVNRAELGPEDFRQDGAAVLLNDAGRRVVLAALEARLARLDLRRRLAIEARTLASVLRAGTAFTPALDDA